MNYKSMYDIKYYNDQDFSSSIEKIRKLSSKAIFDFPEIDFTFNSNKIKTGIFKTEISGYIFNCLYIDNPHSDKLMVTFSHARSKPLKAEGSRFTRWKYHKYVDCNILCIDDPMLNKYENLWIGWFYGDKNIFLVDSALDIVRKIMDIKSIKPSNIIFNSSSAGGYAALFAASKLQNSLAIAVNPQLYINNFPWFKWFKQITALEIDIEDYRFKLDEAMRNSSSTFVIISNVNSKLDFIPQIVPISNKYGITPTYGLNKYKNILFWLIDNNAGHDGAELLYYFPFIYKISQKFKNKTLDIDEAQQDVILLNEVWHQYYDLIAENKKLKERYGVPV